VLNSCTLGTENQAQRLASGLYAYNHNLDTSEEYKEASIRDGFEDRLQTIENVRKTNVTVLVAELLRDGRKR
jgi:biotin synthase